MALDVAAAPVAKSQAAAEPAMCVEDWPDVQPSATQEALVALVMEVSAADALRPWAHVPEEPVEPSGVDAEHFARGPEAEFKDFLDYDAPMLTSSTDALLKEALAASALAEGIGALPEAFRTQEILREALDTAALASAAKLYEGKLPGLRTKSSKEDLPGLRQKSSPKSSPREIPAQSRMQRKGSLGLPPLAPGAGEAGRDAAENAGHQAGLRPKSSCPDLLPERVQRANRTPLYLRMQRDCAALEQQQCAEVLRLRRAQQAVHAVPPARSARRAGGKGDRARAKKKSKASPGPSKRPRAKPPIEALCPDRSPVEANSTLNFLEQQVQPAVNRSNSKSSASAAGDLPANALQQKHNQQQDVFAEGMCLRAESVEGEVGDLLLYRSGIEQM